LHEDPVSPSPDLSIIVPCYNEEESLRELVERLGAAFDLHRTRAEVVLVDDCSTDGTRTVIDQLASSCPSQVRGVFHEANQGIAGGWRSGLGASRAPIVAIMDADLQYAPEDVPRLYQILKREGPDIVQGWRIAHNFKSTYRYLLSLGFSFLLNRLFGTSLRDIKSGFLCTRREVFADILQTRYPYRFFQHFILVNAVSKGYRVRQEPILFWDRHAGESFIQSPLRFAARSLTDLPYAFWEFRVLRRRTARR
jgi:glycosyltransferase involved in cell wall biosynthesis